MQRVLLILYEDHVANHVLPVLKEDQVSWFYRRRDVCDSQVIAAHVVNANWSSEHV